MINWCKDYTTTLVRRLHLLVSFAYMCTTCILAEYNISHHVLIMRFSHISVIAYHIFCIICYSLFIGRSYEYKNTEWLPCVWCSIWLKYIFIWPLPKFSCFIFNYIISIYIKYLCGSKWGNLCEYCWNQHQSGDCCNKNRPSSHYKRKRFGIFIILSYPVHEKCFLQWSRHSPKYNTTYFKPCPYCDNGSWTHRLRITKHPIICTCYICLDRNTHDDVIKWKHFPHYWPFVRGIYQSPVTRSFDVYFDLPPKKRLSKQSWGWWFETQSRQLWRHRNAKQDLRRQFNTYHLIHDRNSYQRLSPVWDNGIVCKKRR